MSVNEMYENLKAKLEFMREEKDDQVIFDYYEVAQMYQLVCFMKQIKEIVEWGE